MGKFDIGNKTLLFFYFIEFWDFLPIFEVVFLSVRCDFV